MTRLVETPHELNRPRAQSDHRAALATKALTIALHLSEAAGFPPAVLSEIYNALAWALEELARRDREAVS